MYFACNLLLLPASSPPFPRVGLPAPGLLSDIGGLEMEEEEERGCVCVRLVSGWRGALGSGGEEQEGTPPAGGGEDHHQPAVEAAPSQPSHPDFDLNSAVSWTLVRCEWRSGGYWKGGDVRGASAQCLPGPT